MENLLLLFDPTKKSRKKLKKKNTKFHYVQLMKKICCCFCYYFNMKKVINIVKENLKTLFGALLIAVLIRSLLFNHYIPSSSMEPTLLVGDRYLFQNLWL